jgi:hypothetical protein
VKFTHSHRLDVAEALGFLRTSKETEEQITQYFADGLTPSSAKMLHEMKLLEQADGVELVKLLANTRLNPTLRTFANIHDKLRYN